MRPYVETSTADLLHAWQQALDELCLEVDRQLRAPSKEPADTFAVLHMLQERAAQAYDAYCRRVLG